MKGYLAEAAEELRGNSCDDFNECQRCPVSKYWNGKNIDCVEFCRRYPDEAVRRLSRARTVTV